MKPADLRYETPATSRGTGLTWLGTAGFRLRHKGHVLLMDPYLTRLSLAQCTLNTRPTPNVALLKKTLPKADLILVGHSHFDHVLDVPAIAGITGATVAGSASTRNVCRAWGLPEEQIRVVAPGDVFEHGPFRVQVICGEHGRLWRGQVPFAGDITSCDEVPGRVDQYKCGQVLWFLITVGGQTFFHHGSAELAADTPVVEVDHLLTCVAGWHKADKLHHRLLHHTNPGTIWLSHYDNFFRPLHHGDAPLPLMKMAQYVDAVLHHHKDARIHTLTPLEEVTV